jgi:hypothetical protein
MVAHYHEGYCCTLEGSGKWLLTGRPGKASACLIPSANLKGAVSVPLIFTRSCALGYIVLCFF